jgi:V-type H+-transporting ATPase subunit a
MYTQVIAREEDSTEPEKMVYIIVYWGASMKEKIEKVADSFSGKRYDLPPISEISRDKLEA